MSDREEVDRSHLENVEDGCGCTEVWEHLSDERERVAETEAEEAAEADEDTDADGHAD
jgi:hypothetical protein